MLSSTVNPTATILRNYAIAATAVLALTNRIATQNTINGYSQYLSAGLVNYAQSSLK